MKNLVLGVVFLAMVAVTGTALAKGPVITGPNTKGPVVSGPKK
jgi:hypothetical protein